MTTYTKYRILLFSPELTDGKFLRVDNLEDGCSAIEAKAVFDEMRRTADVSFLYSYQSPDLHGLHDPQPRKSRGEPFNGRL